MVPLVLAQSVAATLRYVMLEMHRQLHLLLRPPDHLQQRRHRRQLPYLQRRLSPRRRLYHQRLLPDLQPHFQQQWQPQPRFDLVKQFCFILL